MHYSRKISRGWERAICRFLFIFVFPARQSWSVQGLTIDVPVSVK